MRKFFTALLALATGCLSATYQIPGMPRPETVDVYTQGSILRVFNQCTDEPGHLYLPGSNVPINVFSGPPTIVHVREGWFQTQNAQNVNFVYRAVRGRSEVGAVQHTIYIQRYANQYDWFIGGQVSGSGNVYHDNIQGVCRQDR